MLVNTRLVRIEWGDCDPAGIIYYPRYFAFFDASTSALIERALGMNKRDYLKKYDFDGHPLQGRQRGLWLGQRGRRCRLHR